MIPPSPIEDPQTGLDADVTGIQPYQARKSYRCPGCGGEIAVGIFHLVVVPREATDLRRHWHSRCLRWELEHGARRRRTRGR
jgi:hypothetical protein